MWPDQFFQLRQSQTEVYDFDWYISMCECSSDRGNRWTFNTHSITANMRILVVVECVSIVSCVQSHIIGYWATPSRSQCFYELWHVGYRAKCLNLPNLNIQLQDLPCKCIAYILIACVWIQNSIILTNLRSC